MIQDWPQNLWEQLTAIPVVVILILGLVAAAVRYWLLEPHRKRRSHRRSQNREVHDLIRFLENRDVLYSPFSQEVPKKSIDSVYAIRDRLGEAIHKLDGDSRAAVYVEEMQAACRRFLRRTERLPRISEASMSYPNVRWQSEFEVALHELREVFGRSTDFLYDTYKIRRGTREPAANPFIIGKEIEGYADPPAEPERRRRPDEQNQ